jgi:hypothetical protein
LVLGLVGSAGAQIASNPVPADGAEIEDNWAALSWTAAAGAASHDVYFGDNAADVKNGAAGTFAGNVSAASFLVGFAGSPEPAGLVLGRTYYWRVDEVEVDGVTKHAGHVWSFTVAAATARKPNPTDGGRYVDVEIEFTWTAGFGAIMHTVYFGDSAADVEAGTGGTNKGILMVAEYAPDTLELGKTYYWRVDEFDGFTTHKGAVWSFTTLPDIPIFDTNLIGWWKMDDEGTGTIIDYSGYNNTGTMHGDPQFVPGVDGDALEFDGDDYVIIDGFKGVTGDGTDTPPFSITAWIRKEGATGGDGEVVGWGSSGGGNRMEFRFNAGNNRVRIEAGGGNIQGDVALTTGQWTHVAVTVEANSTYTSDTGINFYFDGVVSNRANGDPDPIHPTSGNDLIMGQRYNRSGERWFIGALDDVRVYDKVLTAEEVGRAMLGDPRLAWGLDPADQSEPFIEEAATLSWTPGDSAAQHDVYIGTSEAAVIAAGTSDTTGVYRGRQDPNSYSIPETLDFGQTYYWRIDEVAADGETAFRGRPSSFKVANFIPVDDFESYNAINNEIWVAWHDGLGFGSEDAPPFFAGNQTGSAVGDETTASSAEETTVSGGTQSMPIAYDNNKFGSLNYSEVTLTLDSARDWTRHGVKALSLLHTGFPKSLSSFEQGAGGKYTVAARSTGNISGASDEFHFAYQQLNGAGTIIAKVEWVQDADDNAQAGLMIRDTLDPDSAHSAILLETNDIAADADLLSRTRSAAGGGSTTTTVDEIMAPQWLRLQRDAGGMVRASHSADGATWTDLGTQIVTMNTPMFVGLVVASENGNVTCTAEFSNVQITGGSGVWMNQDVGIADNDPEPMYVAIANPGGTPAVVYHDDPEAARINAWTEWNIDLQEFADQGVDLRNIETISIGLGDKNNPAPGGSGKLFIDDVRLYRPRCIPELQKSPGDLNNDCVVDFLDLQTMVGDWLASDSVVATTEAGPAGLLVHYKFDGNANDSSGNNRHGSSLADPTYVDGKFAQAIHLDGIDDYIAIPDLTYTDTGHAEATVCVWIRTTDGDGQIVTFDRSENWRIEVGGSYGGGTSWYAGAPGYVGWHVYTDTGQVDTEHYSGWPANTGRIDDGKWHHVAGTFNNGTLTIYIDGHPKESWLGGPTFGYGRYTRYGMIGTGSEASYPPPAGRQNGPYLEADLDEVRIYDRALSGPEIAYLADESPADGELYAPVPSIANLSDEEAPLSRSVNLSDFTALADQWLKQQLWPPQ